MHTLLRGLYWVLKKNGVQNERVLQRLLDEYALILRTIELSNATAIDKVKAKMSDILKELEMNSEFQKGDKCLNSIHDKIKTILTTEFLDYQWSDHNLRVEDMRKDPLEE